MYVHGMTFISLFLLVIILTLHLVFSQVKLVSELKELKYYLRSRKSVLVAYAENYSDLSSWQTILDKCAKEFEGRSVILSINCNISPKLCKSMKMFPSGLKIAYYKNGEFSLIYNRQKSLKSLINFLKSPSAEAPWDEDESAKDVVHIDDINNFVNIAKSSSYPIVMMLYAHWCGHCQSVKPEFAAAATILKNEAILIGIDAELEQTRLIAQSLQIKGYPSIFLFKSSDPPILYTGPLTKEGIIDFARKPKLVDTEEQNPFQHQASNWIIPLSNHMFDDFIQSHPSVLIFFYISSCRNCHALIHVLMDAAKRIVNEDIVGTLASVNGDNENEIINRFAITEYPKLLYFGSGEDPFAVKLETADEIINFMKDKSKHMPTETEEEWDFHSSTNCIMLDETNFRDILSTKRQGFVLFYTPQCPHCKNLKPEFEKAAAFFEHDYRVLFGAVNCIQTPSLCNSNNLDKFPTMLIFKFGKNPRMYTGARTSEAIVNDLANHNSFNSVPPAKQRNWSDILGSSSVIHLNSMNFDKTLAENKGVLVFFYAPWCEACHTVMPIIVEAANIIPKSMSGYLIAVVDASENQELASSYQVKVYPTLRYFGESSINWPYDGLLTSNSMLEFLKRQSESRKHEEL